MNNDVHLSILKIKSSLFVWYSYTR